jgi:hypothetical protein
VSPRAWQGVATFACLATLITCGGAAAALVLPGPGWVTALLAFLFLAYATVWALAGRAARR